MCGKKNAYSVVGNDSFWLHSSPEVTVLKKKKKKGFILVGTSCWNPALKDEIHSHVHKSDRINIFYWQLSESLGLLTVSLLAIMEAAWIVSGSSVCCVAAWLISSVADVLILVYGFMNVIIVYGIVAMKPLTTKWPLLNHFVSTASNSFSFISSVSFTLPSSLPSVTTSWQFHPYLIPSHCEPKPLNPLNPSQFNLRMATRPTRTPSWTGPPR